MPELENVTRCPAEQSGEKCNSPVFYDWGIQILTKENWSKPTGGGSERFKDYTGSQNVKICARCTTPYILEEGDLVDVSAELSAEDVKLILSRGQAQLPHPKIKDP